MRNRHFAVVMIVLLMFQLATGTLIVSAGDGTSNGPTMNPGSVTTTVYGEPSGGSGVTGDVYGPIRGPTVTEMVYMTMSGGPQVQLKEVCDGMLCLSADYLFGHIVLGKEREMTLRITNPGTDYMFNMGVEIRLGDGLEVVGPAGFTEEFSFFGDAVYYWQDIKHLQGGETFEFDVTIRARDTFRMPKAPDDPEDDPVIHVPFGERVTMDVNVYSSDKAREIPDREKVSPTDSVSMSQFGLEDNRWTVVPFTILPSEAAKVVKGAGAEWGEFDFSFFVENNTRYDTLLSLTSTTDGSVQIYDLNHGGGTVAHDYNNNIRSFGWTDIELEAGGSERLELKGAFLNKTMDAVEGDNQGFYIEHGFQPASSWSYSSTGLLPDNGGSFDYGSAGQGVDLPYNLATAMDILIHKSLPTTDGKTDDVGYEAELDYTLTIKTNEYYQVDDVVVRDEIGDGQTFGEFVSVKVNGAIPGPGDFDNWPFPIGYDPDGEEPEPYRWTGQLPAEPVKNPSTGISEFTWHLGTLPPETVIELKYTTTVDTDWTGRTLEGGGAHPIYAGDSILNDAEVEGETYVSAGVADDTHTRAQIETPTIEEWIIMHNDHSLVVKSLQATVGDTVTFEIHYDAEKVNAKQKNVEIRDYLPLGTAPLQYVEMDEAAREFVYDEDAEGYLLSDYSVLVGSEEITPLYYPDSNMLLWYFAEIEKETDLIITVIAFVLDDEEETSAFKDKDDQNLITMSFENTPGIVKSLRDSVKIQYAEPELRVERWVMKSDSQPDIDDNWQSSIIVTGEDLVWVKLVVTNDFRLFNPSSTAYNVVLNEILPDYFKLLGSDPEHYVEPAENQELQVIHDGSDRVQFVLDNPIQRGESFTILYSAVIVEDIDVGREIRQQSKIAYYSYPQDDLAPGLEIGRLYDHQGDGPAVTMTVLVPTISYEAIQHGTYDPENDDVPILTVDQNLEQIRVGEWVVYRVAVNVPERATAYNPALEITLPQHQRLDVIFEDNYNAADLTGDMLTAGDDYERTGGGATGGVVHIDSGLLPITPGVDGDDFVFYIRTVVEGVSAGSVSAREEVQSSSAEFSWAPPGVGGDVTSISDSGSVTVKLPKLEVKWYYYNEGEQLVEYDNSNPVTLSQGEDIDLEFVIVNTGQNTAYDFVPVITVPEGFLITEAPDAEQLLNEDTVAQFSRVGSLTNGAGQEERYSLTVEMDEVPGSGSSFIVSGTTGYYYSTPYAYAQESEDELKRYAPETETITLGVPDVQVTNMILSTTNTDDPSRGQAAARKWVRPGDVVTYELTVVVPAGTQAFDLELENQIKDWAKFDWILGSTTIEWNQVDEHDEPTSAPAAFIDGDYNSSTGRIIVDLGDSPELGDVRTSDPEDNTVQYVLTFQMRAKEDGSSPTTGSFQGGAEETIEPSSSAIVRWFTHAEADRDGTEQPKASNPRAETILDVLQPNVDFEAHSVGLFTEANQTRTASYTIDNSGSTPAYIPEFIVKVPVGFNVSNILLVPVENALDEEVESRLGVWDPVEREVRWTNMIIGNGEELDLAFDLAVTNAIGAGQQGLELESKLEYYYSTEFGLGVVADPDEGMTAKQYVLDASPKQQTLEIDVATLSVEVIANSYGDVTAPVEVRPGDVVVYELRIDLPGVSPIYDVVLSAGDWTHQKLLAVELVKDDGTLEVIELTDGVYPLGDLTEDTIVRVAAKVDAPEEAEDAREMEQASYLPSITYYSVSVPEVPNDERLTAQAGMATLVVVQPDVRIGVNVTHETLEMYGDDSTITIWLENPGDSPAYSVSIELEIKHEGRFAFNPDLEQLDPDYVNLPFGAPNVVDEEGTMTLTWLIPEMAIDSAGTDLLEFTVTSTGYVGDILDILAVVIEYHSLPGHFGDELEQVLRDSPLSAGLVEELLELEHIFDLVVYQGNQAEGDIIVAGDHRLSTAPPVTVWAGQEAVFRHKLENIGAGEDTFSISVSGPEATEEVLQALLAAMSEDETIAELFVEGVEEPVLIGQRNSAGDGFVWRCEHDSCVDGKFVKSLLAGDEDVAASILEFELIVKLNEYVSFYAVPSLTFGITIVSELGEETSFVEDTVLITGTPLDGWSGEQTYQELKVVGEAWEQPALPHGGTLTLQAVSAVHVTVVTATYSADALESESITLLLVNEETYIEDGYKLWLQTIEIDHGLELGAYEVKFEALDAANTVLETDSVGVDPVVAANNPFTVLESDATIEITADKGELTEPEETNVYTVTVSNDPAATSIAYVSNVVITLPEGLVLVSIDQVENGNASGEAGDTNIQWNVGTIGIDQSYSLTFTARALPNVQVTSGAGLPVLAELTYNSLPGGEGKEYGPVRDTVHTVIEGSHTLSEADDVELTAGKIAEFEHTLKNTGAGRDVFVIEIESEVEYPATLELDSEVIATGSMVEEEWIWTVIVEGFGSDGSVIITVDAGAEKTLTFKVQVPETAPYGGAGKDYTIRAVGVASTLEQEVTDTFTIIGTPLDGWSGDQTYEELKVVGEAWEQPALPHGGTLTLQAVSAVHVTVVTATYSAGAFESEPITLLLVNEETYIEDGYKLWLAAIEIEHSLETGDYEVKFEALDAANAVLETDSVGVDPLVAANNPFTVLESDAMIVITALKEELTEPEETNVYTVTVSNDPDATSIAHDSTVVIALPEGLVLVSIDNESELEGDAAGDDTTIVWNVGDIGIGLTYELTFTAKALPNVQVTDGAGLPVQAALTYNSLPDGEGKAYGPLRDTVRTAVKGSHSLSEADDVELTAGKIAEFEHTLKNTGAGRDVFVIEIETDEEYPATLELDGEVIATGSMVEEEWIWTVIVEGFGSDGSVIITVDAGAEKTLTFKVQVPETAPYGGAGKDYTIRAVGAASTLEQEVTDTFTIIGTPLDGWSGELAYEQVELWEQPVYGLVDSIFFGAVSAVHVQRVTAEFTLDVTDAEGAETQVSRTAELVLLNGNGAYLNDGYKLWRGTTRLPNGVQVKSSKYDVIYTAYDANGVVLEVDSIGTDPEVALNNPIYVETVLNIRGTVTESLPPGEGPVLIGEAMVELYDPITNSLVAATETALDGTYEFLDMDVARYKLVVSKSGYSSSTQYFYALPEFGKNEVVVDAQLSPYTITLSANPTSILGDGISTTELTAIITDLNGDPVPGIEAIFQSPTGRGVFPDGHTAITDEHGVAKVLLQSELIGGAASVWFPVTLEVSDPVHNLYAKTQIAITFEPAAIIGYVSEMVEDSAEPGGKKLVYIEGSEVVVSNKDIGFYARVLTGPDGKYSIGVPVGGIAYDVIITKPVLINGEYQHVAFEHSAVVGAVDESQFLEYPANIAGGGILLLQNKNGSVEKFNPDLYDSMYVYLDGQDPLTGPGIAMKDNGTFIAPNLAVGTYEFSIVMKAKLDPAGGDDPDNLKTLVVGKGMMQIGEDGELNITSELVDPYGEVRNVNTNALIPNAEVTLYYWSDPADPNWSSPSNAANWEKVTLPMLEDFPPFDNLSPTQITEAEGFYAWMVYPETNYFVVAKATGYYDYISPNIRVDWDIVRHDIWMTPIPPSPGPGPGPGGPGGPIIIPIPPQEPEKPEEKDPVPQEPETTGVEIDLAVDVSADQRSYMEQSLAVLTIDYINRSSVKATDVEIVLDVPEFFRVVELNGGQLSESGDQIIWTIGELAGGEIGQLQVTLRARNIAAQEQAWTTRAEITSRDVLINPEDDISTLNLMLFSNRYGLFTHHRYIIGYPDGEFKPNRNITRAEIATIFARILQLRDEYVQNETLYTDVPQGLWYTDAVEAATKRGLFTGYEDGTFRPDQPITRAELIAVIGRFLELENRPPVVVQFGDITGHWAANIIENVRRNRITEGYEDGSFRPNDPLVRSEAVVLINRMLYRGPLYGVTPSYSDVLEGHWALGDVEESTRSHEARRNPDSSEFMIREIETSLEF